jgi:hypothetical protein
MSFCLTLAEEPEEALWYFILQGFSEAGGFHGIKSKDLCATAQEALDTAEERVIELSFFGFFCINNTMYSIQLILEFIGASLCFLIDIGIAT